MSTTIQSKFLNHLNLLRGLAIVFIVCVHSISAFNWQSETERVLWISICIYGTLIFVFISGYLFDYLYHQQFNTSKYWLSKFKNVILPYIFISMPFLFLKIYYPNSFQSEVPDFISNKLLLVFYYLITGKHIGPMWFIPVLALVFLLSPILRNINFNTWMGKFILMIVLIVGIFTFDFGHKFNPFVSFVFVFPVYLFGMAYSQWERAGWSISKFTIVLLVVLYVIILILENLNIISIDFSYGYAPIDRNGWAVINFTKIKLMFLTLLLLHFLKYSNKYLSQVLELFAKYSFGIYFVHLYLLRSLEWLIKKLLNDFQFQSFSFLIFAILILLFSLVLLRCIKFLTGKYSKYLVGC